jgi:membrane-bound ClpP family serine protease
VLATSLPAGDSAKVEDFPYGHTGKVGATGTALHDLHPAGSGRFGERKLDVITRGEYIVGGTEIKIIEIEGNRIVVAEQNSEETA